MRSSDDCDEGARLAVATTALRDIKKILDYTLTGEPEKTVDRLVWRSNMNAYMIATRVLREFE